MGWTSYHATHYKNGRIDRKAEMDDRWTQTEHDGYPELTVLKSHLSGSVYYAAVQVKREGVVDKVFGTVALTHTNRKDHYNFSYKDVDETSGPFYYDCPKGILDLLTPTDSEWANEWRNKCREHLQKKKDKKTKGTLPIGTMIKFKGYDGKEVILEKMAPAYQFSRPWWYNAETNTYCPSRRIPEDFEIIESEDKK